jgi:hypothetical protein
MNMQNGAHFMSFTLARFQSSRFLSVGTCETPCACSTCWQQMGISPSHFECLSDFLQLPWHLWTDAAFHDKTCRGVHWFSWSTFSVLLQTLSFIYNSQINGFRTHVDTDRFSCFGMWNSCFNFVRIFQLHRVYVYMYTCMNTRLAYVI